MMVVLLLVNLWPPSLVLEFEMEARRVIGRLGSWQG